MKKKGTVTIYDIARAAGVAPGTVSRTLNNIGYIKEETRQKIEKVVRELEFTPNRAARTLKTKRTGLVLLAIPDTDNPFYVDLIKAVQEVLKHDGYSLVLYYTEGKPQEEIKALRMQHENFADGMILINFDFSPEHAREIERVNTPLVLSGIGRMDLGGREEDRFDYVGVDTEKGMYLAVRHMIQQGHTRIGYIGGSRDIAVFGERYRGYCTALADSGLAVHEALIFWKNYTEASGYEAGRYFAGMEGRPSAVCAANDMLAMGAMRALEENGILVPQDLSLAGMDNIDMGARLKPRLTSVSIAQEEIGRTAAELVVKRLKGEETGISRRIIFEPRLVVRESSIVVSQE